MGIPFLRMFGEDAPVPCETLSGRTHFADLRTPVLTLIRKRESAFGFAKENLRPAEKKMKENYDLV